MQLSEAIILGDTLKKCDPTKFISADGSCGCAFGGALLAVGMTAQSFGLEMDKVDAIHEIETVRLIWPWLTFSHVYKIGELYFHVANGKATIYDVRDYVRSVEPEPVSTHLTLDARERVVVA